MKKNNPYKKLEKVLNSEVLPTEKQVEQNASLHLKESFDPQKAAVEALNGNEITDKSDFVPDVIGKEQVLNANQILQNYKSGKNNLEKRITDNDLWWKRRHWEQIRDVKHKYYPSSAWLFNSIANKHADVMDNFPEPVVLPREQSDTQTASVLTQILPVILEQNDFEELYSDAWYDKLKSGTGVYGIFWDPSSNNGTGDIKLRKCDILNLFWEPGVTDIQDSRNLFYIDLCDNDILEARYPFLKGKLGNDTSLLSKYQFDGNVSTDGKSLVVDWYYKKKKDGRTVLHYVKYCSGFVLYATENDENMYKSGLYQHGKYPFVFDKLYNETGTPAGFGFIDIMKDSQTQIDLVGASVAENVRMASRLRYFARSDGSINEEEFANWDNPIVHYTGSGNPNDSITPIHVPELSGVHIAFIDSKINELKETSGNLDFTRGNTTNGVTAASAIAALQEAGSKLSRDMIKGSYRAFTDICTLIIELMRQFYTVPRMFRTVLPGGHYDFVSYSNQSLIPKAQGSDYGIDLGRRTPVFDIRVKAQKATSFSRTAQNELAKEFYALGFFDPANAGKALACLEMMDFEGKDAIAERLRKTERMMNFAVSNSIPHTKNNIPKEVRSALEMEKSRGRSSDAVLD